MIKVFSFLFVVSMFFVACKNKGTKAEVSDAEKVSTVTGTDFNVDTASSSVMWTGFKPTGKHNGTINIENGTVTIKDGKIVGGKFTLDMNSIAVLDLDGDYKADLEAHLKGTGEEGTDDFFNVTKYPTATYEITNVTGLENNPEGTHMIYGNLTLKDIIKQVAFIANVDITEDAVKVTTPPFEINRTDWGINYKSKSVFDNLKEKFINDEMAVAIKLNAKG